MRKRRSLVWILLVFLLLACNFPMVAPQSTPTAEATLILPSATSPAPLPTFTALPSASPAPTVVPTPSVPVVTPNSVNVNCRSGPDVAYDSVGVLVFGSTVQVVGRSEDSSWWYVHNPSSPSNPNDFCWIFSGVVSIAGPTAGIPVKAPPAAIVTKVSVDVSLPSTIACGGPNPVSFSGAITTNGTATVQYQWEVTGDKTNTTSPETLSFSAAGTQNLSGPGAYSVDCGSYKITLHVIGPNDKSASKNFTIAGP